MKADPSAVVASRSKVAVRVTAAVVNGSAGSSTSAASRATASSSMPCDATSCRPGRSGSETKIAPIAGAETGVGRGEDAVEHRLEAAGAGDSLDRG